MNAMLKTVQNDSRHGTRTADAATAVGLRSGKPPAQQGNRLARLQSACGNQHMQRLLRGGVLQAKLTVNQPGDAYEQEADRMADAVMRMSAPDVRAEPVSRRGPAAGVQRCSCGNSSDGTGQCEDCKTKAMSLQRATAGSSPAGTAPPIVHDVLRSPGQPLDAATRSFMEPRFGRDFSGVRVHTDAKATESARALNALAYTVGENVVFGSAQFSPSSASGRSLLAHELAHVLQQAGPSSTDSNFLQRAPDTKKPAAAASDCTPSPETYDQVISPPEVSPGTLGYTKPDAISFDLEPQFKKGTCNVKLSEAKLSFKYFMFTKEGTYLIGTAEDKSKSKTDPCSGKKMDAKLTITRAMAERIKQGEIEHCNDAHRAFDLSYGRYNEAGKNLASGFSAKDQAECNKQVLDRLGKAVGVDTSKWKTVADCLLAKTLKRDESWHKVKLGDPSFDKGCKTATFTPDPKKNLTEVGKHPSTELVKDCGEK